MPKRPDAVEISYSVKELIELVKESTGYGVFYEGFVVFLDDCKEVDVSSVRVTIRKVNDY